MFLSLDLSTKSTGLAVFDGEKCVHYECIKSASTDLIKRIIIMRDGIEKVLINYPNIDTIYAEEVIPQSGAGNIKTHRALTYVQAALEFLIYEKYNKKIKIEYIYPSSWRSKCGITTGRGVKRTSLKEADIAYVKDKFGVEVNDDIADAICIGYSQTLPDTSNEINWT